MDGSAAGGAPQASHPDGDATVPGGLAAVGRLVRRLAGPTPDRELTDAELLEHTEVETAYEELRVADEELRAQQAQLESLLAERAEAQSQRSWLLSMLSVPVVTTDSAGTVVVANAAAAAFLRVPVGRLRGTSLSAYVDPADRDAVDGIAGAVGSGSEQLPVRVLPRHGEPVQVRLMATAEASDRVSWILLDAAALPDVGVDRALGLVAAFAQLSRLRSGAGVSQDVMHRMAACARAAVPAASGVSLVLGLPSAPEAVAATAGPAAGADGLQVMVEEGPCVDAYVQRRAVDSGSLAQDPRWPRLAARLGPDDVVSVVAVPIESDEGLLGALGCYSCEADAFDAGDLQAAELIAQTVGAVLTSLRQKDELRQLGRQLTSALESRAVIEQAKGIVMAERSCTPQEAFDHLSQLSQRGNVKVRDVARLVVDQAVVRGRRAPSTGDAVGTPPP
ncbi:MAG: GAF and ANTAR domain-containing protein [Actinotalea sp.]|nr:GAF and ANTAR domain-containing protein [Actinotalea sp.]